MKWKFSCINCFSFYTSCFLIINNVKPEILFQKTHNTFLISQFMRYQICFEVILNPISVKQPKSSVMFSKLYIAQCIVCYYGLSSLFVLMLQLNRLLYFFVVELKFFLAISKHIGPCFPINQLIFKTELFLNFLIVRLLNPILVLFEGPVWVY